MTDILNRLQSEPDTLVCSHWGRPVQEHPYLPLKFNGEVKQFDGSWVASSDAEPLWIYFQADGGTQPPLPHTNWMTAKTLLKDLRP